jgi:hypothetical protein
MTTEVRNIPMAEATEAQKRTYASQFLNLDLSSAVTEADVDAAIGRAQPNVTMIFVLDAPIAEDEQAEAAALAASPEDKPSGPGMVGSLGRGDPRAVINIPVVDTKDSSGRADVVVGVNGRAWQMQRGVDISIPWRVVEALQNARGERVEHEQNKLNPAEVDEIVTPFQRHAFSFIEKPSKDEIDAWFERTKDEFCA